MVRPNQDTGGETAVEFVAAAIKARIRSGQFAPGQRLVANDLMRSIGVSAGPIREALRKLTGEGIIEIQAHRGAIVRELSRRDIQEIYQAREAIEGQIARLAAQRIEVGENRSRFTAAMEELRAAHRALDTARYNDANQEFHDTIYAIGGNKRLIYLAEQLAVPIYTLRYHQLLKPSNIKSSVAEHEQIADALLDGDGDRAERVMRMHVRNSGDLILQRLAAE